MSHDTFSWSRSNGSSRTPRDFGLDWLARAEELHRCSSQPQQCRQHVESGRRRVPLQASHHARRANQRRRSLSAQTRENSLAQQSVQEIEAKVDRLLELMYLTRSEAIHDARHQRAICCQVEDLVDAVDAVRNTLNRSLDRINTLLPNLVKLTESPKRTCSEADHKTEATPIAAALEQPDTRLKL